MNSNSNHGYLLKEEGILKQIWQYFDKNPNLSFPRTKSNVKQENEEILPTSTKKERNKYLLGPSLATSYYKYSYDKPCKIENPRNIIIQPSSHFIHFKEKGVCHSINPINQDKKEKIRYLKLCPCYKWK